MRIVSDSQQHWPNKDGLWVKMYTVLEKKAIKYFFSINVKTAVHIF